MPLFFAPQLDLDNPPPQTAIPHRHPHRDPNQVGVVELDPGVFSAVVEQHFNAALGQVGVELLGRVLRCALALGEEDDVYWIRRDGNGPHQAVVVVVLLSDAGQQPPHADPIRPHDDGPSLALGVEEIPAESLGEFGP